MLNSLGRKEYRLNPDLVAISLSAIVFVVGIVWWGIAKMKSDQLQRAVISSERQFVNAFQYPDLPQFRKRIDELDAKIEFILTASTTDTSVGVIDGIELGGILQNFIFDYRNKAQNAGITILDRSLGFDDYTKEVALLNSDEEKRKLVNEWRMTTSILDALYSASPIRVNQVERVTLETQLPQNLQLDPLTGTIEQPKAETVFDYRVSVTFEGYTSALRDFLKHLRENNINLIPVSLEVIKSEDSEADNTSQLFAESPNRHPSKMNTKESASSLFAEFTQTESPEDETMVTLPLIGEVVSRFRMVIRLEAPEVQDE